jgi:hypothetical protein
VGWTYDGLTHGPDSIRGMFRSDRDTTAYSLIMVRR